MNPWSPPVPHADMRGMPQLIQKRPERRFDETRREAGEAVRRNPDTLARTSEIGHTLECLWVRRLVPARVERLFPRPSFRLPVMPA